MTNEPLSIVGVGINHRTAPVEVRERVTLVEEELSEALDLLRRYVPSGAILSTCNRTEVYSIAPPAAGGRDTLSRFLSDCHRIPSGELNPYLYGYDGRDVVEHLFGVACGIDSMVLGETEIMGQVRDALAAASDAGMVRTPLSRLFHDALRTGRTARERTAISRHTVSVSHAAVQMARQVFSGLEHCRVLVISAGEAGNLTAKSLRNHGAGEIGVANRTRERAAALAEELGGRPVDYESIGPALLDFDIVISATASARYVLPRSMVEEAVQGRAGRPLCLIDIAVPRDVDPESRLIEGVYLYDIDDLEAVSLAGLEERRKAVGDVQQIIDGETQRFMAWFSTLEAVPVIKGLQRKAEEARLRELEKTLGKLRHLSPEDRDRVEALSKALVKRILHDPILSLKADGQTKGYIEAVRDLFSLGPD